MSKKIVINAVNGGYFVTVDDGGLPWVYQDIDKMLAKVRKELTSTSQCGLQSQPEPFYEGPDWVKEELEKERTCHKQTPEQ